jgi:hypothetical protein
VQRARGHLRKKKSPIDQTIALPRLVIAPEPSFPPKRAICRSHYFFLARLTKIRVTHRVPNLVLRRIGPWREKLTDSGATLSNEHVVSPQREVGVCRT